MPPLVDVRHLVKEFTRGGGLFRRQTVVRAVDDVSFTIDEGETFALVGESGSGKTTTGRCMLRLIEPTSGAGPVPRRRRAVRSRARGCAPRGATCRSSSRIRSRRSTRACARARSSRSRSSSTGSARRRERRERVAELFELVGLEPAHLDAIRTSSAAASGSASASRARSRSNPSFIIADEPVSALDVSVQAQVINLLMDLQEQLKLTYLFIAHDLRLVRHISSRVAVMYLGKIVEMGPTGAHLRAAAASLHAGAALGGAGDRSGRAEDAHRAGPGSRQPRRAAPRGGAGAPGGGVGALGSGDPG